MKQIEDETWNKKFDANELKSFGFNEKQIKKVAGRIDGKLSWLEFDLHNKPDVFQACTKCTDLQLKTLQKMFPYGKEGRTGVSIPLTGFNDCIKKLGKKK